MTILRVSYFLAAISAIGLFDAVFISCTNSAPYFPVVEYDFENILPLPFARCRYHSKFRRYSTCV